ncbi:hypothetical protein J437_LFUL003328 [Ladona fulva]|uniref:Polycystin cation channel PKD1/PKD2 domain-containing protein n=1 Tax=Ladona fulva TaxID=123851 RepID=A0A8K0K4D2_LADFU|nr:hypothetical protein J437_LFUL003328 [Ladona fulva]
MQIWRNELWRGNLNWPAWRIFVLFLFFLVCPPVWVWFTLPLGHKFNKIPIIKFMSYLTSHIYLMLLLSLVGITPMHAFLRPNLFPHWYEWLLLVWLSGLLLSELTNPSDKSGLGWIKVAVLGFGVLAVALHLLGLFSLVSRPYWPTLMYLRNQLLAIAFLLSCVQILDFLSFHHLFGPWAIIIGDLMKDLGRFTVVLSIFIFGFSMHVVALNHPKNESFYGFRETLLRHLRNDGGEFSQSGERAARLDHHTLQDRLRHLHGGLSCRAH